MMVPRVAFVLFNTSALTPVLFSAMVFNSASYSKCFVLREFVPYRHTPCIQVNVIYTRLPSSFVFLWRLTGAYLQKCGDPPARYQPSEDFTAPRCTRKEMAASSVVEIIDEALSPSEARHKIMEELKEPVVFTNMLKSSTTWEKALGLTPQSLASLVPKLRTKFKICPRIGSKEYETRFKQHETVFETHCTFVEATFGDFCEWLEEPLRNENTLDKCQNQSNALLHFPKSNYWVYADYKYLCN